MKTAGRSLTLLFTCGILLLSASCEPGAQSNTTPGEVESSGADNKLESAGEGRGASPEQVPPSNNTSR